MSFGQMSDKYVSTLQLTGLMLLLSMRITHSWQGEKSFHPGRGWHPSAAKPLCSRSPSYDYPQDTLLPGTNLWYKPRERSRTYSGDLKGTK